MSNDKLNATGYTPAQDPWAPLPQRTPMEHLAAWGEPPPDPAVDRMYYASPGPAPWGSLYQDIGHEEKARRLPPWAWVSIVLGVVLLVCGSSVAVTWMDEGGSVVRAPAAAPVTTTGTCEKRIVGGYGLVATVRATNATDKPQIGSVWVQWPITGESAQRFVKPVTIQPGQTVELPVNQEIPSERWFRTGACSYGWDSSPN